MEIIPKTTIKIKAINNEVKRNLGLSKQIGKINNKHKIDTIPHMIK